MISLVIKRPFEVQQRCPLWGLTTSKDVEGLLHIASARLYGSIDSRHCGKPHRWRAGETFGEAGTSLLGGLCLPGAALHIAGAVAVLAYGTVVLGLRPLRPYPARRPQTYLSATNLAAVDGGGISAIALCPKS